MIPVLKFLGRASYFNNNEPKNSAYYKKGNNLLLIDCGMGVFEKITQLNLLSGVNNVYVAITHMHKDHVADLPLICEFCKKNNFEVNLIKNSAISSESLFCMKEKFKNHPHKNYIATNLQLKEGEDYNFVLPNNQTLKKFITIKFKEVPHVDYLVSNSIALKIEEKNIFYSGDCTKVPFSLKGFDQIYLECSPSDYNGVHLSFKEINNIVNRDNLNKKNIRVMHLESKELEPMAVSLGYIPAKLET